MSTDKQNMYRQRNRQTDRQTGRKNNADKRYILHRGVINRRQPPFLIPGTLRKRLANDWSWRVTAKLLNLTAITPSLKIEKWPRLQWMLHTDRDCAELWQLVRKWSVKNFVICVLLLNR